MNFLRVTEENIADEHICCALGGKKTSRGVALKKEWLQNRFHEGLIFQKADVQGKVFIEYLPAENAWCPIHAADYMFINCFWVAGKYQKKGYGARLLEQCMQAAAGKNGLVIISSNKKRPYLADKAYLLKKGFEVADQAPPYFELLVHRFKSAAPLPSFKACAKTNRIKKLKGLTVMYTDQCPYIDHYVHSELDAVGTEFQIPIQRIKFDCKEQAQNAPVPFTAYSAFYNNEFLTHEILTKAKFKKIWDQFQLQA
ncbi:GNAT family N-acetyltransferase [bacterium BFN5]|nr:GNAT family N-acetyltransferase [bacterium BFN5]QJW45647.1 GNAT family N-acetyltransferase [bacterium BFN5]